MVETMIRKQIYLTRRQDARLKRLAKHTGIPQAEIIRQVLDRGLDMPVAQHRDSKKSLEAIFAYARSLGNRSDLLEGQPYTFNRDEIYSERETLLIKNLVKK